MIALLTNPPTPLALCGDLLGFRRRQRPPAFPELIWKLHQIIANRASRTEDVKVAKRALLRTLGQTKQFPQTPGRQSPLVFAESQHGNPRRGSSKTTIWRAAHAPNYRRSHETNQN